MSKDRELLQEAWIAHWQSLDPMASRKDAQRCIEQIINDYAKRRGIDRLAEPQTSEAPGGYNARSEPQSDAMAGNDDSTLRAELSRLYSHKQSGAARLADEIHDLLRQMAPHVRDRLTSKLLERAEAALRAEGTPAWAVRRHNGEIITVALTEDEAWGNDLDIRGVLMLNGYACVPVLIVEKK